MQRLCLLMHQLNKQISAANATHLPTKILKAMPQAKFSSTTLVALLLMLLSSCVKDVVTRDYTFYRPQYKTKTEVRAAIKSDASRPIQHPGKIYYRNGYAFISEIEKGIHIIDISNAAQPTRVGFVAIPGAADLAVRGNILYADMYTDLVAIDISNPADIKLKEVVEGVFPHRIYEFGYGDTSRIITDWIRVDTVIKQGDNYGFWGMAKAEFDGIFATTANRAGGSGAALNGVGGSMARFALSGNYLYTVSHSDLKTFDVNTPGATKFLKATQVGQGWGIETIWPYKNNLFIGAQAGMFIASLTDPQSPKIVGTFEHARVCDPVVADDHYAYVTLRDGTECRGFINQMDVVDISNLSAPKLIKSYPMTNPHGLGYDGDIMLLCDGRDGLRVLDIGNVQQVRELSRLPMNGAYDVIPLGGVAMVLSNEGFHLVEYSNPAAPVIKSTIPISPAK